MRYEGRRNTWSKPKSTAIFFSIFCLFNILCIYSVFIFLENSCGSGDKYFQIQIPESATKTECAYNGIQGVEYYRRFWLKL